LVIDFIIIIVDDKEAFRGRQIITIN